MLDNDFRFTFRAMIFCKSKLHTYVRSRHYLENRWFMICIAGSTYLMRWFGALGLRFQDIGKRPRSDRLQFVALLLSIPCFKVSHAFFKFAYRLNQFHLRRLCGEDFFLKFYDRSIATGSVVDILKSLRDIKSGLDSAHASEYFSDHVSSSSAKAP